MNSFFPWPRFDEDDLNPQEVIIYRAYLHPVAFFISSWPSISILSLSLGIIYLAIRYAEVIGFFENTTVMISVLLLASLPFFYGLYRFIDQLIDWLFDVDIVTNQRIIDYDQQFLFSQDISTASLRSVENTVLRQSGFFRQIFNYGTLDIQTSSGASVGRYLLLFDIAQPRQVQRLIDEIAYRVKKEVEIDPIEVLIASGLKQGDIIEYQVQRETQSLAGRIKNVINWSPVA